MYESTRPKVKHVASPYGRLTASDLPAPHTKRWSIRRKAEVVAAVRGGLLSFEEASRRYALNVEEFLSWECCIRNHGLQGLRTTHTQFYLASVESLHNLKRPAPRRRSK